MTDRKAYAVSNDDGDGIILFAKSDIEARRKGANDLDHDDISGLSCRRVPWADQYADTGIVPAADMIDAGWWLECRGCERRIDGDEMEDGNGDYYDPEPCGTQHAPYCTPQCQERYLRARARIKRAERRAFEVLKRELLRKIPGITIDPMKTEPSQPGSIITGSHHSYVSRENDGTERIICVVVGFKFPGSRYGGSYRYDRRDPQHRYSGPATRKRHLAIANGDKEAWDQFRGAEVLT